MFERVRQRVRDVKTVSALCKGAERHARDDGQHEPGAEHFLLSALDLPDGSARRVFERLHVDASQVRAAIRRQYADALRQVGVDPGMLAQLDEAPAAPPRQPALYRASASGQAVMQGLAQLRAREDGELLGAHVVAVVASMQHGVAARALRAMGVDAAALAAAAAEEVEAPARA
jgi:ATP-dependent Clp protease ATP-binding subunit ClpA